MSYDPTVVNRLRYWIETGEITELDTLTWGNYAFRDFRNFSGENLLAFSQWMKDGETFGKKTPGQVLLWLLDHDVPFTLSFTPAVDVPLSDQFCSLVRILALKVSLTFPELRMGAIRVYLKTDLTREEKDILSVLVGGEMTDPVDVVRELWNRKIPFQIRFRLTKGERKGFKENLAYHRACLQFVRAVQKIQKKGEQT